MSELILTPAYGRDYKSKDALLKDYNSGKDFIIQNFNHQYQGKPINKRDVTGPVKFRYDKLRKSFYL